MSAIIWTTLAALLQIALLVLQAYYSRVSDRNKQKAAEQKGISDATASGDVSRINNVIGGLRR